MPRNTYRHDGTENSYDPVLHFKRKLMIRAGAIKQNVEQNYYGTSYPYKKNKKKVPAVALCVNKEDMTCLQSLRPLDIASPISRPCINVTVITMVALYPAPLIPSTT